MQHLPRLLRYVLAISGTLVLFYILFVNTYLEGSVRLPWKQDLTFGNNPSETKGPSTPPPPVSHSNSTSTPNEPTGNHAPASNEKRILLVSSFFPLEKSKHTDAEYDAWIQNFIGAITTDIYMFTTPIMAERIAKLRAPLPSSSLIIDTSYASPFDTPPMQGKEEAYKRIRRKDRERFRHSPELYAVWNSKPFFLHHALEVMKSTKGKDYDYAFWNDAGSFRDQHVYRQWPSPARVKELWVEGSRASGLKQDDLIFFPMWGTPDPSFVFWSEGMGPVDNEFSEGSFFGGSPRAIDWFARTFYAYHKYYLSFELFVGKDQTVINALFLLFPDRFITVYERDVSAPAFKELNINNPSPNLNPIPNPSDPEHTGYLGQCNSEWFYYQFMFADQDTREKAKKLWINKERSRWRLWGWWKSKDLRECRETRILDMKGALRKVFGDGWNGAAQSLKVPDTLEF
ncbi:hypothetical protein BJ165DRAFT_1368597 [Panaeolus papilionaceus]|nr:hypothetical protein BJ165DRAFT_1368597 [Panaeolus papilionaceus]